MLYQGYSSDDKFTFSLQEPQSEGPFPLFESSKGHVTFSWNVALPGVFLFHACAKAPMPPDQVSVYSRVPVICLHQGTMPPSQILVSVWYLSSLDYPGSVRWQPFLAPHICLGNWCSTNVATRMALPKSRIEKLIGSQANYEIKL